MDDGFWDDYEPPLFCSACGAALVEVKERDGFDRETGEPAHRTWIECPRRAKTGFTSMFKRQHTSISKDNPLLGRVWR